MYRILLLFILCTAVSLSAENLVILHTNDTHSQIDPDSDGCGGVLRRKAIIDSIRATEPYVMLLDAGDAFQGTPYFNLFGGIVECETIKRLGYDIQILGNHEFDNGIDSLARVYGKVEGVERLSSNYVLDFTPLKPLFKQYIIKEFCGRRIGVIALNLIPSGMIADANCRGLVYSDAIAVGDSLAGALKKNECVDYVVALTHIGYTAKPGLPSDVQLAKNSRYIDLIIGGHSHTTINPGDEKCPECIFINADGRKVVVCQAGGSGKQLGCVKLDLDDMSVTSSLMPVDKRYDDRVDSCLNNFLAPYRAKVDSLMNNTIIVSEQAIARRTELASNFISDLAMDLVVPVYGGKLDLAIMNVGGMRRDVPRGDVSEGLVKAMFPFDNKLQVLEIRGDKLIAAFAVMAGRGGDSVSHGVKVEFDGNGKIVSAKLNGKKIKKNKKYILLTLDYLANGGDYMEPLKSGKRIFSDSMKFGDRVLDYLKTLGADGGKISVSDELRMEKIK
ncbi:MAG: bifunctional metallophosphatase/5'-nucleotidase [Muribaculaceae bacterium]